VSPVSLTFAPSPIVVIVDTETTGLNPATCGLIQLAAVAYGRERKPLAMFHERIKLETVFDIDPKAIAVNGYDPATWGGELERVVLTEFRVWLAGLPDAGALTWCGANVPFDQGFLKAAADRHFGWRFIERQFSHRVLDVNSLAFIPLMANAVTGRSMSDLRQGAGIPKRAVHDALQDCLDTRAVLEWMFNSLTWSSP